MTEKLTSSQFLEQHKAGRVENALLPIERDLIAARLGTIKGEFAALTREKAYVAEQSGDNWHDGAFRATDDAAKNLSDRQRDLVEATHWPTVLPPAEDDTFVSIGSRVQISQNNRFTYFVDVVGKRELHDYGDDDEQVITSIASPIGKAILGRLVGDEFRTTLGNRDHTLVIMQTIPSPELVQ